MALGSKPPIGYWRVMRHQIASNAVGFVGSDGNRVMIFSKKITQGSSGLEELRQQQQQLAYVRMKNDPDRM